MACGICLANMVSAPSESPAYPGMSCPNSSRFLSYLAHILVMHQCGYGIGVLSLERLSGLTAHRFSAGIKGCREDPTCKLLRAMMPDSEWLLSVTGPLWPSVVDPALGRAVRSRNTSTPPTGPRSMAFGPVSTLPMTSPSEGDESLPRRDGRPSR